MSRNGTQENLTIALGISAVDVLTCALVSSIVLFLILAAPARALLKSQSRLSDDGVVVRFAIGASGVAIRVLVYPGQEPDIRPVEFWSNRAAGLGRREGPTELGANASLYRRGGYAQWFVSDDALQGHQVNDGVLPEAALVVSRPKAGKWQVQISYNDFVEGKMAREAVNVKVFVTSLGRSCADATGAFDLMLAKPVLINDANKTQGSCSLGEALSVDAPAQGD